MYHRIEDQEKNPQDYVLTKIDPTTTEDECYDFLTKPRQTQKTIGFYLKKVRDSKIQNKECDEETESWEEKRKKFTLRYGDHTLERELNRNKGFWVDKPQNWAHLTYKLRDKFTVEVPRNSKREQGIFCRPNYMELDYHIKLANAGLLYPDEEEEESEEEEQPDTTECLPLRKQKYKICDPCKVKEKKSKVIKEEPPKDLLEEMMRSGQKPKFKKIPTGCQCDFFGEHNTRPTVWDNPFKDRVDMLRQHEMNKYLKPYKCEILNKNYEKNPPVKFMAHEFGRKKTFPIFLISNL